jgi:hypothetical protein
LSRKTFLAVVLLSYSVIVLLAVLGLPPGHSAPFNYAWSVQYTDAFSWAYPFPRYLPGLWAGFGGYDFFFYAPLPFWFIAALVDPLCWGCQPSTKFVIGGSVVLVASGFAMFRFLQCFFAVGSAAFGAAVYVILPYHLLIDWFERQAVGEFTAYAFIPLIALGTESIRRNARDGWILTLGVAGTVLSHLPTALLVAHVFSLLFLFFTILEAGGRVFRIRLLARFVWFGGLGLAMASFYWLPAILLLDSVSPKLLFGEYFEAWRWLYGPASTQPNTAFATRVLASFLACVPLLLVSLRYARGGLLVWIVVPAIFALFMNTAPSEPIWREWIISRVQFPWRLMTIVDFATGIAAAVLAANAIDRSSRIILAAALAVSMLPIAFLATTVRYTQPDVSAEQRYLDWFAAAEYFSPEMANILRDRLGQQEIDHFDGHAIAVTIVEMEAEFQNTVAVGEVLDHGPRSLTVVVSQEDPILSLPVQYWFLWKAAEGEGRPLEIRSNPTFGTLDVIAPESGFQGELVSVWLAFHWSELLGIAASLLALLLLVGSSVKIRWGRR